MFGSLKEKFKRWQEAGLISEEQSASILAFEKQRKGGKLIKDLTNVGIFAILLGLASIVASNWTAISDAMKMIGHFALNLLVVAFMLRIDGVKHPVRRDACVLLLFGLFLTFIALIGQTYQLHGDLHTTLLFWLGICTPFVWYLGRTYTVAVPWLLAMLLAIFLNIDHYLDGSKAWMVVTGVVMSFYLPTILLLVSRWFWLARNRPGFVQTFYSMGIYLPAIFANLAMLLFYDNMPIAAYQTLQVSLMAFGLLAIFFIFRPISRGDESATDLWYYMLVSHMVMLLPFVVPTFDSDVLAAVLFILYWIFIAWLGARMQAATLTDWAIRLVILRLFIVYLEVFGNMLQTGFGLVISGILLLVVLRYLNRIVAVGRKLVNYEIT